MSDLVRSKTGGRRFRTTRELGKREERGKEERIDGRKTFASRAYLSCKKCRQSAWHLSDAAGRQPESREDTVERPDEKRKGQTEGVEGKKEGKGIWVSSTFSSFLPLLPFVSSLSTLMGLKPFFPRKLAQRTRQPCHRSISTPLPTSTLLRLSPSTLRPTTRPHHHVPLPSFLSRRSYVKPAWTPSEKDEIVFLTQSLIKRKTLTIASAAAVSSDLREVDVDLLRSEIGSLSKALEEVLIAEKVSLGPRKHEWN